MSENSFPRQNLNAISVTYPHIRANVDPKYGTTVLVFLSNSMSNVRDANLAVEMYLKMFLSSAFRTASRNASSHAAPLKQLNVKNYVREYIRVLAFVFFDRFHLVTCFLFISVKASRWAPVGVKLAVVINVRKKRQEMER